MIAALRLDQVAVDRPIDVHAAIDAPFDLRRKRYQRRSFSRRAERGLVVGPDEARAGEVELLPVRRCCARCRSQSRACGRRRSLGDRSYVTQ